MKRLSVLVVCAFILAITSTPAMAQISYCKDFLESGNPGGLGTCDVIGGECSTDSQCAGGALACLNPSLKTWDETWTLSPGGTVAMDIWLNDVPEDILFAGFFITFDPTLVNITTIMAYDDANGGLWDSGGTQFFEVEPGQWFFTVLKFSCVAPDGDGDIVLAKTTFECQGLGNADITISTIPGFDSVVGCAGMLYDPQISPNIVTIHQEDICEGNFDGDQDVDGTDAAVFKSDFGRSPFSNPCPSLSTTTTIPGGCLYGMVDCGTKCVDPMTDEDYCGVDMNCLGGMVCGATERCVAGVCEIIGDVVYQAAVPKTGQTTSYATGDDGDLEKGVTWPNPRFTDNGDGTVTDNLTGLIWLKNAYCFGSRTWNQALSDCNGLASGVCGLTDGSNAGEWRLPSLFELESLRDMGHGDPALPPDHPFDNVFLLGYYWTSTTIADVSNYAGCVDFVYGLSLGLEKLTLQPVWPVR